MKIKKVDDKTIVFHTKEKAKIHAQEPKKQAALLPELLLRVQHFSGKGRQHRLSDWCFYYLFL